MLKLACLSNYLTNRSYCHALFECIADYLVNGSKSTLPQLIFRTEVFCSSSQLSIAEGVQLGAYLKKLYKIHTKLLVTFVFQHDRYSKIFSVILF